MSEPDPSHRRRVLIIDDEEEFTELLRLNLARTQKFEIAVENESTRALETARGFHPDVILLDIVMPGIDGGDLSSKFRQDPILCEVPIILVSALVSNAEVEDDGVAQTGDKIILAKPVKMEKLLAAIEQSFEGTI